MEEGYYYIIKDEFFQKFESMGSKFKKNKGQSRPTFCCFKDKIIDGLYWAIPTSNGEKKGDNIKRVERVEDYCKRGGIEGSYYHLGRTNKKAIFCISSAFPITSKYVKREYIVQGNPLQMTNKKQKEQILQKLRNILSYEQQFPNKLETHISAIREVLKNELSDDEEVAS